MDDALNVIDIHDKIRCLEERILAIEKEQRRICEDILSDDPKERMQKRILERPSEKIKELKERIDKQIRIEI